MWAQSKDLIEYRAIGVFWVPPEARWSKQATIGQHVVGLKRWPHIAPQTQVPLRLPFGFQMFKVERAAALDVAATSFYRAEAET